MLPGEQGETPYQTGSFSVPNREFMAGKPELHGRGKTLTLRGQSTTLRCKGTKKRAKHKIKQKVFLETLVSLQYYLYLC